MRNELFDRSDGRVPILDETRHRLLGAFLAIATLVLYTITCARTVHWGDSGELIMAGAVLGVAHPPGHPLYSILAHVFTYIPFGGIAFRINWFSAVCGAIAVWLTYGFAAEALRRLEVPARTASVCAVIAAGLLALTTGMWDGGTVAETTTLHAAFMAGVCWYVWRIAWDQPSGEMLTRRLAMAAFLYGLSATNHVAGVFFLPAFAVLLVSRVGIQVLKPGNVGAMFACVFLGLSLYVYLPLRSLQDPLLDWGNPETLDNFLWVITAKQYRSALVPEVGSVAAWTSLGARTQLIAAEWGILGVCAGVIGWLTLARRQGAFALFILLGLLPLLVLGLSSAFILAYFVPGLVLMTIPVSIGFHEFVRRLLAVPTPVVVGIALAACVWNGASHYAQSAKHWDNSADIYGRALLDAMPQNAVLLTSVMESAFAPWAIQVTENYRTDVAVIEWTWATGNDPLRETVAERYPDIIFPTQEDLTPYAEAWGADVVRSDKGIGAMMLENVEHRPLYVHFGERPTTIPDHFVPEGGFFVVRAEPGEYITSESLTSVDEYWDGWDARLAGHPYLRETQLVRNLALDATIQGMVFEALDAPKVAAELYERGQRIDPSQALPYVHAGMLLAVDGKWSEALQQYEWAVERDRHRGRAHYLVGTALEALGRLDEAYAAYVAALSYSPADPDVLQRAGDLMRMAGEFDRALDYLHRAAVIAPDRADVVRAQARLALAQDELDVVSQHLQHAQRLGDSSVHLTLLMAEYASRRGQATEAAQLLADARVHDAETVIAVLEYADWVRALDQESALQ